MPQFDLRPIALGWQTPPDLDWSQVKEPESQLLTLLGWHWPGSERLAGLRRYTWVRYQQMSAVAKEIRQRCGPELILVDDLALASHYYPHPSARSVAGVDFLAPRASWHSYRQQLPEWSIPAWAVPPDQLELRRQGDGLRLRFHAFRGEASQEGVLCPSEQAARCLAQAQPPWWLVDLWMLQPQLKEPLPNWARPLWRRACQISVQQLGRSLSQQNGPRGLEWLLWLTYQRSWPYSQRLFQFLLRSLR